jgi:hypothetical protein
MTTETPDDILCAVCGLKMILKQTLAAASSSREQRFYQCEPCGIGEWRVIGPKGGGDAGESGSYAPAHTLRPLRVR